MCIGGFSQEFFMYGEDDELCFRMKSNGWEVWYTPTASIIHFGGASTSSIWSRKDKNIRMLEAKYRLLRKYFPTPKVRLFLAVMMVSIIPSLIKAFLSAFHGKARTDQINLKRAELDWVVNVFRNGDERKNA
jgi:GT2 family glycosyltransferase